jgi:hypothetical protein
MRDQEILGLYEAYQQVHQVDEGRSSRPRYPGGRGVLDQEIRDEKREASAENMRGHTAGPGSITKNPKKLRKQKAMGELGEQLDIYDIILSHLLDEGYAETPEAAEVIMVNMSEDWRESIFEEILDEGAAGAVAARAQKLANQRKGQTPERKATYQNLAKQAGARERGPHQRGDNRTGMTSSERERRRDAAAYHSDLYGEKKNTYGKGGVTKNPRKLAQQKARGQHAEQYDIYDIILSHLLDEGYAETVEAAEVIMVNMSEDWGLSIVEEILDERNRGEQGMSDREVTRRRNLGGNTRSTVSSGALGDHGSQGAIQKFHKRKQGIRQAIHKSGRYTRGDTGESGGKGRYEANKDHADGYPSITKRGQGPG